MELEEFFQKHGLIFGSIHHVRIRVLDPVQPASFKTENPYDLAKRFNLLMKSEMERLRAKTNN